MTNPTNPQELFSPFLPATYNIPEEEDRLKPFLNDKLSGIADVVNDKKIGVYFDNAENFNGEKWGFLTTKKVRNGYQAIAYIPSFPGPLTLPVANQITISNPISNINPQFIITHTWGSASLPCTSVGAGDGIYFSFFTEGNSQVTYTVSDTQIVINTTVDLSTYSGFIVIEYLRDGF